MPTTPEYAIPYPQATDTPDVPRDIRALAERVAALLTARDSLPAPVTDSASNTTTMWATANGQWVDLPFGGSNPSVSLDMPHPGLVLVEWGALAGCKHPLAGELTQDLSIAATGATTLTEVEGSRGDLPRVTAEANGTANYTDATPIGHRVVAVNKGVTVFRMRCYRQWSAGGSARGDDTYLAQPKLTVTPLRFTDWT